MSENNMIVRKICLLLLPLMLFNSFMACQKKAEQEVQAQQEGSLAPREDAGPPLVSARVPDDAEMQAILQTQQAIMANPFSDSLRRELGRKAIDAASSVIWTVGTGRVADPSSAVALSNAERAAWADGNRWAAYLIEWQKNSYSAPFGSVQAQVPGSMIERKSMSDSLCVALVKTGLP
jgi:hypothetical protein